MKKIQLKAFDRRRNQNFWFHFCYISEELWEKYTNKFKVANLDSQVKSWLKQDFNFEVVYMEDLYEAKEHIKKLYADMYPDVFLANEGDRQGWARVWLSAKINSVLEVK